MNPPGRIRDEDIEEVRRRASIVDIASEYMQVRRAGRLFKALCPFHNEKSPSLSIDPAKSLFHCFGCGEGGDVITLVRKIENLSFVEAIESLARRTGVQLRYEQMSAGDRKAFQRRMRLVDAHRIAADLYHEIFMGPAGVDVREYWKGRGLNKQSAETWRIGLSVGARDVAVRDLTARGFSEQDVLDAGLALKQEGGGIVDRFRGRLMFPIFDLTGDPVAFGARRLEGDGPKYLNSAESPIYKKAHLLYGLNRAKGDIVKGSRVLIVEGYTDVIALHQAGFAEAVATCGTALGEAHLDVLRRFTPNIVISLDPDEAGARAADRTFEELSQRVEPLGVDLRLLVMPPGQDPADSVVSLGADGFRERADGAIPLLEFVLRREADRYSVGTPEDQAKALAACVRLLAKTERQSLVDEYVRRLADWIHVDAPIIYYELERMRKTGAPPRAIGEQVLKRSSGQVKIEKEVLKLAIQHAPMMKEHAGEIDAEHFSIPSHREIWAVLSNGDDPESVLEDPARRVYFELAVQPPEGEVTERLVRDFFARLQGSVLGRRIEEKKARLQRLNPEATPEEYHSLFAELVDLEAAKRRLGEEGEG